MPRLKSALVAVALTLACGAAAGAVAALDTPSAQAAAVVCDAYGRTTTADGRYVIQNNRWGTTARQCITPTATGFEVSAADADVSTSGAPAAYPSIYWGCHYATCTPGFSPVAASSPAFGTLRTKATMSYPTTGGSWDAAYDLWFDPTARTDGQNTGAEVMVWLNHSGPPQPIGSKVATVTLEGAQWDVWFGNTGWNVVSYVRTTPTASIDVAISSFFDDALARGYTQRSWFLTSVQAGFEPWKGGTGLAVRSFEAGPSTAPTTPTPTRTPTAPTSTAPATSAPATSAPATTAPTKAPAVPPRPRPVRTTKPAATTALTCTATVRATQSWTGGRIEEVTVGSPTARTGWTTTLTLPAGQRVVNLWNGSWTQTGTTVVVRDAGYNASLTAGGSTTFGYQLAGTTPGTTTARCA